MNLLHYIYIIVLYRVRPIWIDIQTSDGISVANKDISAYKNVVLLYFEYLNWIEVICFIILLLTVYLSFL